MYIELNDLFLSNYRCYVFLYIDCVLRLVIALKENQALV